jgi:glycerol-3-phosphate dehydrogenase (NAD(P)+)
MINTEYFKVLASYDVKGVLIGGALKNVLAIAGGII